MLEYFYFYTFTIIDEIYNFYSGTTIVYRYSMHMLHSEIEKSIFLMNYKNEISN